MPPVVVALRACASRLGSVNESLQVDTRVRQVTEAEAQLWAQSRGFLYFEVSAKTGARVCGVCKHPLRSCMRGAR